MRKTLSRRLSNFLSISLLISFLFPSIVSPISVFAEGSVSPSTHEVNITNRLKSIMEDTTFGLGQDERFDLTRFNVMRNHLPAPVLEYPINRVTISNNRPLMQWTDVTFTDGRTVKGYNYEYYYDCTSRIHPASSCAKVYRRNNIRVSQLQAGNTADGLGFWRVQVEDSEGNLSQWSRFGEFTVDTGTPTTTLVTPVGLVGKEFTVSGLAKDNISLNRVYVQLLHKETKKRYGGTAIHLSGKEQSWSKVYNATDLSLPDGHYAAHVSVVDNAGNNFKVGWSEYFELDKTYPEFAITSPVNKSAVRGTQRINAVITDKNDITKVIMNVGGKSYSYNKDNTSSSISRDGDNFYIDFDTTQLADGNVYVVLRATDGAGNVRYWNNNAKLREHSFIIDNTAPTGEIIGIRYPRMDVTSFITNDKSPLLYGTYEDNLEVDTVKVEIGGVVGNVDFDNGNWSAQFPRISDGTYMISLKITDKAGNESEYEKEIVIDSVPPTATYRHYVKGELFEGDIVTVKNLSDLSFTAEYTDTEPSSGLRYESFVIFEAQDDGSFGFSRNGKKSYCSWRRSPNLVELSGSTYELTEEIPFTKCIENLPDGEYYMAHHVYDNAVRSDIPSISQFRDVLGLHFIIKNTPVVSISTPYTEVMEGAPPFEIKASVIDGNAPISYEWVGPNSFISNDSSFEFNPTTPGSYTYTVKVTDADGDYDEESVTITIKTPLINEESPNEEPLVEKPEVQGTTDRINTPSSSSPRNKRTSTRNVVLVEKDVKKVEEVEGESLAVEEEAEESVAEVLGEEETSCKVSKPVWGYLYIDKNKNDIKDNGEKVFENIKVKITTMENGQEKVIEELVTDKDGEWRTTLCLGRYNIAIDTTTIPKGYTLNGNSRVSIEIKDDSSDGIEQPFLLSETKTFIQKYWWVILLLILLSTGVVVSKQKKENN